MKVGKIIALILYYVLLNIFHRLIIDFQGVSKSIRYQLVKRIFKVCGNNVNVERKAKFGSGRDIEIGDNSGIGVNANIPSNTKIGENVMIGPNYYILDSNHSFDRTDIPMMQQGNTIRKQTIIGDDVWIGRNVTMTPGRIVKEGTIIGACCVLTKKIPEYSIIGGNPSKLIRSRK